MKFFFDDAHDDGDDEDDDEEKDNVIMRMIKDKDAHVKLKYKI